MRNVVNPCGCLSFRNGRNVSSIGHLGTLQFSNLQAKNCNTSFSYLGQLNRSNSEMFTLVREKVFAWKTKKTVLPLEFMHDGIPYHISQYQKK